MNLDNYKNPLEKLVLYLTLGVVALGFTNMFLIVHLITL